MGTIPTECEACHMMIMPGKPDPCLGTLPGVKFACCGHGGNQERQNGMVNAGYITFENDTTIRFGYCLVDDKDRQPGDSVRSFARPAPTKKE